MSDTRTRGLAWYVTGALLIALILSSSPIALALIESVDDGDPGSSVTLESEDADSLRAGGFIWSDGLTEAAAEGH